MWILLSIILWFIIDKLFNGEFTHELGTIAGLFILFMFTIAYIMIFAVYPDYNWIDIFLYFKNHNYNIDIKW
jgi:hypothetical protein